MKKVSSGISYANVVSTICLFLLLGGGAAYAASHVHLGKNAVGANQLKKNAVTNAKIKNGAVTGAKVKDGSLTGADIEQASLTSVRASNVTSISLSGDGNCTPIFPLPAGVSSSHTAKGVCKLTFPTPPTSCVDNATVHLRNLGTLPIISQERTVQISDAASNPKALTISTYASGVTADLPFDLVMVC